MTMPYASPETTRVLLDMTFGTREEARVRVGNEVDASVFGRSGIADRTTNTADTVDAQGRSRVHIGNKYGGRGIFDD